MLFAYYYAKLLIADYNNSISMSEHILE